MLHVIVLILKIIGIVLLVLLGLVLLLLLLVLFVPIRYRADGRKDKDYGITGRISWFGSLVLASITYDRQGLDYAVRIFGKYLIGEKAGAVRTGQTAHPIEQPELSGGPSEPNEDSSTVTETLVQQESASLVPEDSKRCATDHDIPVYDAKKSRQQKSGARAWEKGKTWLSDTVQKLRESVKQLFRKVRAVRDSVEEKKRLVRKWTDFWHRSRTQAAKEHLLREIRSLLKHILPYRVNGAVHFGFEDPALTGQVLGMLCVLSALSGNKLETEADFEQKILEGEFAIRGRIRLCHIAKAAASLFFDKNVRKTYRSFQRLRSTE